MNFSLALLTSTMVLTSQSLPNNRYSSASKFVLGAWILAAVVITAIYGGIMVSFLSTTTAEGSSLNTLEDLLQAVKEEDFHVTALKGTSMVTLFETADPDSIYGKLSKNGFREFDSTDTYEGFRA
ncbi:unnamed protein product, partial [Cyprideis torosa]